MARNPNGKQSAFDLFFLLSFGKSADGVSFTRMTRAHELKLTFSFTFSNDAGATTEKHTRKTSVCGYDNGLFGVWRDGYVTHGMNPTHNLSQFIIFCCGSKQLHMHKSKQVWHNEIGLSQKLQNSIVRSMIRAVCSTFSKSTTRLHVFCAFSDTQLRPDPT